MSNSNQVGPPMAVIYGGIIWLVLFGLSALGELPLGAIELIFLMAPLVIIPLGLGIVGPSQPRTVEGVLLKWAQNLEPAGATMVVASFCMPPGVAAALLAAGWLLVCSVIGLCGLFRLWRNSFESAAHFCPSMGLIYLPVGGVGLVASRWGLGMMNFKEPIVLLTAVHFHYAGFAAPLLVGATGRVLKAASKMKRGILNFAAWGVIVTPGLVAVGFVVSPLIKAVSAFILAASLIALSVITLEILPLIKSRMGRGMLAISALSVPVGMMLVCVYAIGDFVGDELISIPHMAMFHGIANSVGFALCGLLAWSIIGREESVRITAAVTNNAPNSLERRIL